MTNLNRVTLLIPEKEQQIAMKGCNWSPFTAGACSGRLRGYLMTKRHGHRDQIHYLFNPLTAGAEYIGFCTQLSPHFLLPFEHVEAIM